MTFDFEIVPIHQCGIERYQKLLFKIIEELHWNNKWLSELKAPYSIEKLEKILIDPSFCCIAAVDKLGNIVGILAGKHEGGLGLIHWLGVEPMYRGRGIGSALLARAEEIFYDSGCHGVELRTLLDNLRLEEFYQKRGYNTQALLPNYRFGVNAIHMIKQKSSSDVRSVSKLVANL